MQVGALFYLDLQNLVTKKRVVYLYLYLLFECFKKWVSCFGVGWWGGGKEGCDLVAGFDALRVVRILRYYKQLVKFSYLSCKS